MRAILQLLKDLLTPFWIRNNLSGSIDEPDIRDHIDTKPKGIRLPNSVNLRTRAEMTHLQETGKALVFSPQSTNSCTAYASQFVKTITNLCKNGDVITHDEEFQWLKQEEEEGATRKSGCTLQGACHVILKWAQGFPLSEYRRINKGDLRHIKCRLATGSAIFSGVTWKKTEDGRSNTYNTSLLKGFWEFFTTKRVGGHAVGIYGYDDTIECLFAYDPMQKRWGANEKSLLLIPYSEVDNMMSMYIFYDLMDK